MALQMALDPEDPADLVSFNSSISACSLLESLGGSGEVEVTYIIYQLVGGLDLFNYLYIYIYRYWE